ncbi:MAG TPA: hypothetical protein DCY88_23335 [Cyanobacteria bacterium UBA11372]|nr:hypothetical protein [Cyanobacteria bacterium UBA11372]
MSRGEIVQLVRAQVGVEIFSQRNRVWMKNPRNLVSRLPYPKKPGLDEKSSLWNQRWQQQTKVIGSPGVRPVNLKSKI